MFFLKFIRSTIFQILSFLFVLGYLLGILNLHFNDKNNYCVMTYMFEYPKFVPISVPENALYPQYGLYAYSEGRFTERARKMWFTGIPVLFIPGNSGSHMQARSIASVALRKALQKDKYEYHFDYFTVSYNEELSALYGGVLQSQTEFAASCISKILSLYKDNNYTKHIPTSVILIGHSMGGIIAKRLLAYPSTIDTTTIAIALAAPLQAPVINTDLYMNYYYKIMEYEWELYVKNDKQVNDKKMLISFGNGPRDTLMPSGLTRLNESHINALTTAIPGVWVSPDHVSIVWCKQLVLAINRFLFAIVDPLTQQLSGNKQIWMSMSNTYFQANRSMILSWNIPRANLPMVADAFWYEDSRRIYQISRPEITKMTYLMIRLVTFPQNRFVAIEATNLDDREWVFGCNAMYTYGTYRYCKQATSLSELTRWTGAATNFGRRKLATINLHRLKDTYPDWTHVIVKVSPTRKPVVLNVDINDHASRVITVSMPSELSFEKKVIIQETEANSLYYELVLPGFYAVHQTYLLYVEPTASCKASQYHISAELHVPWAENNEYFHYFTHLKQSPMKLRIFTSNPNATRGDPSEHVKITLLLDPQCTYTISICNSWYNRLAQLARNYTPVLLPYTAAIILLAARSMILQLRDNGTCLSIHGALMSEGVKPHYALVFARLATTVFMSVPALSYLLESANWDNLEIQYFTRSLVVLPAYMTALGIVQIVAAAAVAVMVFSSQLAHRLLFRIIWRGGPDLAERLASSLQKVPFIVTISLGCAIPLSCGAAAIVAGAAYYAFMISKMYEEYLEDYVYKLMAKLASKMCYMFKSKASNSESETSLVPVSSSSKESVSEEPKSIEDKKDTQITNEDNKIEKVKEEAEKKSKTHKKVTKFVKRKQKCSIPECTCELMSKEDELNYLNFHVMMFFLWICVAMVNVPTLLTWARNFKFSMVLRPDTSKYTGFAIVICSGILWQMDLPRRKLRYYDNVAALLFTMAVLILSLGPLSLIIINYGVTLMIAIITLQQWFDEEVGAEIRTCLSEHSEEKEKDDHESKTENISDDKEETKDKGDTKDNKDDCENETKQPETPSEDCNVCDESRIYTMFKGFRDKFTEVSEGT
ncbi:GPI inositol-deacylase isoform X1 [Ostrinia furnacalis]|uniref:GPI inositol-deacylase isoform X1 n=1 Tax=Ostrinia furnacalis TaxID=93504 RepID=UPI00103BA487|nr:GPI inositol-deacylase isoform X1 [Ostrinia furnacalis]